MARKSLQNAKKELEDGKARLDRCKEGIRGWQIPACQCERAACQWQSTDRICKGTAECRMAEVSENQASLMMESTA